MVWTSRLRYRKAQHGMEERRKEKASKGTGFKRRFGCSGKGDKEKGIGSGAGGRGGNQRWSARRKR